jgi:hypothetical protein
MDERKDRTRAEATCQRLGELAAATVPAEERAPDARQWAAVEARLDRRRVWRLVPALALGALAAMGTVTWLAARRTLDYRVQACTAAADGALTSVGAGTVSFADGSKVELETGARLRVRPAAFARGAELALEDGNANLSIVHRPGARWAVVAGPYRVEVTGTRFTVRWSRQQQSFRLAMLDGEVWVSGGALARSRILRAGQSLQLGEPAQPRAWLEAGPAAARGGPPTIAGPPVSDTRSIAKAAPPAAARTPSRLPGWRRRAEAAPEKGTSAKAHDEPAETPTTGATAAPAPATSEPAAALARPSLAQPAPQPAAVPAPPTAPIPAIHLALGRVTLGPDGQLSGGMTGFAWLAGGAGTTISGAATHEAFTRLVLESGQLCARGTVAALRCVNEDTPQARCNWDRNWGVAIGLNVKADGKAWGEAAAGAIAVEFHGRSSNYRLITHRNGDPDEKIFCVENYKSGQIARPSMFKSQCWADQGDTLPDFKSVDQFNLQFASGMAYVAFRYCITGVQLLP